MKKPPNELFLMADQFAASALPVYGNRVVRAPRLSRLAGRGAVFDSAYCNFPICAASRTVGRVAARISRLDGMKGHARAGCIPLAKYWPSESFDLGTLGGHSP